MSFKIVSKINSITNIGPGRYNLFKNVDSSEIYKITFDTDGLTQISFIEIGENNKERLIIDSRKYARNNGVSLIIKPKINGDLFFENFSEISEKNWRVISNIIIEKEYKEE